VADPAIKVVHLVEEQIDDASSLLARAFFDAPVWTWMLPNEAQRRELMPWYMRMSLRYGIAANETYTTAGTMRGIAMWQPPGRLDADLDDPEASAMWEALPQRMGEHGIARFNAMIETQRPVRERVSGGKPVWNLPWLAVEPAIQRRGVGKALLAHTFARADAVGEPCLLDTLKQANVPYYERHGFAVVATGTLPLGGPGFWLMLRQPGAGRSFAG
jgi:GNAT superfamily N-acetyltransferase